MNAKVSVTNRVLNHRDRIRGSWLGDEPSAHVPVSVEIHLTDFCNAACPFCFYADSFEANRRMSDEMVDALTSSLISMRVQSVVLSGGGEPTLHPQFSTMVHRLISAGIEVGVITNGILQRPEITQALLECTWVKISLHCSDAMLYPALMGRSPETHEKVCAHIRSIVRTAGRKPRISVGCVVTRLNDGDEQVLEFLDFAAGSLGTDYILYKPFMPNGGDLDLASARTKEEFIKLAPTVLARAETYGKFTNFKSFVRDYSPTMEYSVERCRVVWEGLIAVVRHDGEVFSCLPKLQEPETGLVKLRTIQDGPTNSFGSLRTASFDSLWSGERRRNWLLGLDARQCDVCRYQRINKVMDGMVTGEIPASEQCHDAHSKFL